VKKDIKIEINFCNCHPDTCSCDDYILTYKGETVASTSDKTKLEAFIKDIKQMRK
jgi:hypothetical protein